MSDFNPLPIHVSAPRAGAESGLEGTDSNSSEIAGDMGFAEVLAKQADAFAQLGTPIARAESARFVETLASSGGKQLPVPTGLPLPIASASELETPEALAVHTHPSGASQTPAGLPLPIASANELEPLEALALQTKTDRASQTPASLPLPIVSPNELEPLEAPALHTHAGRASQKPQELFDMAPLTPNGRTVAAEQFDLKPILATTVQLPTPESRYSGRPDGIIVHNSLSGELTPLNASASYSPLSSDILELQSPMRLSIPVPTSGPDWNTAFANRVAWMVNRNLQIAELQLYPPELGRVEVRISVQNGAADIHFGAQHVLAREAIESALPKLRETLAEGGLDTVTVDVSRHALPDGRSSGFHNASRQFSADTPISDGPVEEEGTQEVQAHDGLIDHYV